MTFRFHSKARPLAGLLFFVAAALFAGKRSTVPVAASLERFLLPGHRAIDVVDTADLNGDGTRDVILVMEKKRVGEEWPLGRVLLILTRDARGNLTLAKRSDSAIGDDDCGGVSWGDCYEGITVSPRAFEIETYGGGGWRVHQRFLFRYSRIDRTWQLVRAEIVEFPSNAPPERTRRVYTPRNFGKIDITEFDMGRDFSSGAKESP